MSKKRKGGCRGRKSAREKTKIRELDRYDALGYERDLEYLGRLSFLSEGTRAWIEARMYELREKANVYEHRLGGFLMERKVEFIHQAPFVFRPRTIYFCDFYIPSLRIAVEVDGNYHDGPEMRARDAERDANFRSVGIRVVRVANAETLDTKMLAMRLSQYLKPPCVRPGL